MTSQEQDEYWHKWNRFQRRYEEIYTSKVYKAILEQVNVYVQTKSVDYISSQPIYDVLKNLYQTVGVQWAAKTNQALRQVELKYRLPMGFSEQIVELMRQYFGLDLLNMSENITSTTRDLIVDVLSEASREGWSFDEIVAKLRDTELNRNRARLIARTEVNAAANQAAVLNGVQSKLILDKVWISVRDGRTRSHHVNMDGHLVGMNDDFIVGGKPMSQPGDKRGGPAECCNCRCVVALRPRRDASGRLVRQIPASN